MKKYKDRKGINLLTIFLVIDLLAVFAIIKTSGAVYTSEAIGTTELQVAFYAFDTSGLKEENSQTSTIELGEFVPGDSKTYRFTVFNKDQNGTYADTNLSYILKIITTTNLPLEYELYYNESEHSPESVDLISNEIAQTATHKDEWGTYFRSIVVPEKCFAHSVGLTDYYKLVIKFPDRPEYHDPKYQDILESVKVQLTSKQVMNSDIENRGLVCRTR